MNQINLYTMNDISLNFQSSSPESKNSLEELEPKNLISTSSNSYNESIKANKRKKRKSNVRACDACAIRKVKCESMRPCSHCVSNNLNCTQLRERKKSGPKNLHRKTLESINNLGENNDGHDNQHNRPSLSMESSSNTIPLSKEVSEDSVKENKLLSNLTPNLLIENLSFISEEPVLLELLKPFTVQSLLINKLKLLEFLLLNFRDHLDEELLLNLDLNDSMSLSKLLIILTLNLLIIENLVKLNKLNFKSFIIKKNIVDFLNNDFLNQFKDSLKLKIVDVLSLIDKNMMFPVLDLNLNQYQIYYNLSLSSLHLFNYYQISSINSKINSEVQDQQKSIYLRKSITYYQLINIPQKNDLNIIQLFELYEYLYTIERYNLLLSSNTILNNCNYLILNDWKNLNFNISHKFNKNSLFEIFKPLIDEDLFNNDNIQILMKFNKFNYSKFKLLHGDSTNSKFCRLKDEILQLTNKDSYIEVLKLVVVFKVLLANSCSLSFNFFKNELKDLVRKLNEFLSNDTEVFKVHISNYQLLPHLLQLLKFLVDTGIEEKEDEHEVLIYSHSLIKFFPFFNNINKLIRSNKNLNSWFLKLNNQSRLLESRNNNNNYDNENNNDNNDNNGTNIPQLENDDLLNELLYGLGNTNFFTSNNSSMTSSSLVTNYPSPGLSLMNDYFSSSSTNNNYLSSSNELSHNFAEPQTPEVTATTAISKKDDEPSLNSLSLTESAKNLYNLFNQINDDLAGTTSSSFSNLLQFATGNIIQDDIKLTNHAANHHIKHSSHTFTI